MSVPERKHDNSSAIAYGWYMLLIFLFVAAIVYLIIGQAENTVMDKVNAMITMGKVSQQTMQAIEWNRNLTMALPILSLLGAFIWSVIRGVGGRGDSYGGATFQAYFTGWVLLVMFCLVGFLASFMGGLIIDSLYTNLDNQGLIQSTDVSAEWNHAQASTMWTYINGYYLFCFCCPLLGLLLFFQHMVRKTYGSRMTAGY